jgi:hypothetical protein
MQLPGLTVAVYGPLVISQAASDMLKSSAAAGPVVEIGNLTVLRKLATQRYGAKGAAVMNVDVTNCLAKQDRQTQVGLIAKLRRESSKQKPAFSGSQVAASIDLNSVDRIAVTSDSAAGLVKC